ncbi:phage/plasmid replication protein, II/X family [Kineobactrum salinum]|uniref:phage/plasmid replication protein, II/X family n=1 Tax=Kineobactrum salinum TaxID=2708301 RepID=UPI0018D6E918
MIDWLDLLSLASTTHTSRTGHVILPAENLNMTCRSGCRPPVLTSENVVRSQGGDGEGRTELYISGNPAKFLQGHNVFGCELVCDLAAGVVRKILDTVGISSDLRWPKLQG